MRRGDPFIRKSAAISPNLHPKPTMNWLLNIGENSSERVLPSGTNPPIFPRTSNDLHVYTMRTHVDSTMNSNDKDMLGMDGWYQEATTEMKVKAMQDSEAIFKRFQECANMIQSMNLQVQVEGMAAFATMLSVVETFSSPSQRAIISNHLVQVGVLSSFVFFYSHTNFPDVRCHLPI